MLRHAFFAFGLLLACGGAAYAQEDCEPIPTGQITGGEVSAQEFQRLLECAKRNLAEAGGRLNDLSAVKVDEFASERDALARTLEVQTADLKEARAEIERLVAERNKLAADLAKANGDNEKAKTRIAALQNEIERLAADLKEADAAIDQAHGQIDALQGVIDQMTADIKAAKDQIATLGGQIDTLTAALQKARADAKAQIAALGVQIDGLNAATAKANAEAKAKIEALGAQIVALNEAVKKANADAKAQIAALGDQIVALKAAAEKASAEAAAQIAALGVKIDELTAELKAANEKIAALTEQIAALTDKLTGYRAQFFARLKTILQGLPGIVIVDDHVIVEAEVLFAVGSEKLDAEGQATILKVATAARELQAQIPPTMKWALQVNGHTDTQPIRGGRFASNWELSTARALTVVKLLQQQCVSPEHLIAAGFGEYQPLNEGKAPEILKHNRRIEMLLTDAGLGPLAAPAAPLPASCSKP